MPQYSAWGKAQIEAVVRDVVARYGPLPGTCARDADLDLALRLASAARVRAGQLGVDVAICVVDGGGNQVLLHRMPNALLIGVEVAPNKAWTAAVFRRATAQLGPLAEAGGPFPGLGKGNERIVLFGGGVPLVVGGAVIGALGISGGTVEQDCDVADYAIDTVLGENA